jgi:hypothetical protein
LIGEPSLQAEDAGPGEVHAADLSTYGQASNSQ